MYQSMRPLLPIQVTLAKPVAEPPLAPTHEFYIWLGKKLTNSACVLRPAARSVELDFLELATEPARLRTLLNDAVTAADDGSMLVIDLAANPYDLLREPLLRELAEFICAWVEAGTQRDAALLLPSLPPKDETSIFWPAFTERPGQGKIWLIGADGQLVRYPQKRVQITRLRQIGEECREKFRSLHDIDLRSLIVRRLGHFEIAQHDGTRCARYFFDGTLSVEEISHLVRLQVGELFSNPSGIAFLTHGPRSDWLHESARIVAASFEESCHVDLNDWNGMQALPVRQHYVLLIDVVNSGQTLSRLVAQLTAHGTRPDHALTVMLDEDSPDWDGINLGHILTVKSEKVRQTDCPQCKIGLPYTDPNDEDLQALRAFDAWDMLLFPEWIPEPYAPNGARLIPMAPDMVKMFTEYGDWIAFKLEVLLKSLQIRNHVIFVCPDESCINSLIPFIARRFLDRPVAIRVPRTALEQGKAIAPSTQFGWQQQLLAVKARPKAKVVLLDEFNASNSTASDMITLAKSIGIEPAVYIPILNRVPGRWINGIRVRSLYELPAPRESVPV